MGEEVWNVALQVEMRLPKFRKDSGESLNFRAGSR